MRDPCPYCGLPKMALSRVDWMTQEIVRDIRDHNCYAWVTPPVLTGVPTDTSFIAAARNSEDGYERYVKSLYNRPRPDLIGTGSYVTTREEYEERARELTRKGIPHDYIQVPS